MILSIDAVNDILDEMAEGFPAVLFEELNGGVNLLEEAMPDPEFPEGEMYFLGEFCDDCLGRYINLYYGSFVALAEREDWTEDDWRRELRVGGVFLPAQRSLLAAVTALGSAQGAFTLMNSPIPTALTTWNMAQLPNGQPLTLEDGGWTMTACLTWEDCIVTAIGMVALEEEAEEGTCQFTLRLEKTE